MRKDDLGEGDEDGSGRPAKDRPPGTALSPVSQLPPKLNARPHEALKLLGYHVALAPASSAVA